MYSKCSRQQQRRTGRGAAAWVVRGLTIAGWVAVMAAFAPAPVEAAPVTLTCGFGNSYIPRPVDENPGGPFCEGTGQTATSQTTRYSWGNYWFDLTLVDPVGGFNISVTDDPMDQSEFESYLDFGSGRPSSPSYLCIPMVDPNGTLQACRNFDVVAPDRGSAETGYRWSSYLVKIAWLWDSENNGYSGVGGRARILHSFANGTPRYEEDMCLTAQTNPAYVPCNYVPLIGGDPIISSGDTDFSGYTAAIAVTVPEPAALTLLLGAGTAWWWRRRRDQAPVDAVRLSE